MDGRGDHRAGNAQTLADMALHLGAEDHLGLKLFDGALDLEIVVGDQRLDADLLGGARTSRANSRL